MARHVTAALCLVGLIGSGAVTYSLIRNPIPIAGKVAPAATAEPAAGRTQEDIAGTPAPSNVVITNKQIDVPGSIVYAKSGNLFVQSGTGVVQITHSKDGSQASQPTWSSDGQWIYYIDTRITSGTWGNPDNGGVSPFRLTYPVLCRVHADGSGEADLVSGILKAGKMRTFFWMRHPSISPDGSTAAVISDGPTAPGVKDNLLSFISLRTGAFLSTPYLREMHPFGHSEPAYSPDGKSVAYVMEGRDGADPAPSIWIYDVAARSARLLVRGYRGPEWSPDGKYLAVAKVSGVKLDVAILDASTGGQVGQVTSDGRSWAPVWSPSGDRLAYMHLTGSIVDLYLADVVRSGAAFTFGSPERLTEYSGLDGSSPAAWSAAGSGAPSPSVAPSASP